MQSGLDIDKIVAEVLQRLGHSASRAQSEDAADTLALSDRVITLEQVEHRLEGVATLQVPEKTVVTPSVRDLLRQQGVTLERVRSTASPHASGKVLLAVDANVPVARVLPALPDSGRDVATQHAPLESLLAWSATQATSEADTRIVLVTPRTFWAAATANRNSHLRAATIHSPGEAVEAARELDANLFVARPGAAALLRAAWHAARKETR